MAHLLARQVRRDADASRSADLGEGTQENVVARVQREPGFVHDAARLLEIVVRLLDRGDVGNLGQLHEQVGSRLITQRAGML